jgi:hypothetical protein
MAAMSPAAGSIAVPRLSIPDAVRTGARPRGYGRCQRSVEASELRET